MEYLSPGPYCCLSLTNAPRSTSARPFPNLVCPCVSEELCPHPAEPGRTDTARPPGLVYYWGPRGLWRGLLYRFDAEVERQADRLLKFSYTGRSDDEVSFCLVPAEVDEIFMEKRYSA